MQLGLGPYCSVGNTCTCTKPTITQIFHTLLFHWYSLMSVLQTAVLPQQENPIHLNNLIIYLYPEVKKLSINYWFSSHTHRKGQTKSCPYWRGSECWERGGEVQENSVQEGYRRWDKRGWKQESQGGSKWGKLRKILQHCIKFCTEIRGWGRKWRVQPPAFSGVFTQLRSHRPL